jgi:hypothetical protein
MYWNGFMTAMTVVLQTKHSDGTVEQHELLPTQVFQDGNN